jgi:hypothetical protein
MVTAVKKLNHREHKEHREKSNSELARRDLYG